MIRNYLTVAVRHLLKYPSFTGINIVGMTVGLTAFLLISLYISHELSFDSFHANRDQLFRVTYQQASNGSVERSSAATFYGVGEYLVNNFPDVEAATHFYKWPAQTGVILKVSDKVFNEPNYFFADSTFFKVFGSLLLHGDAVTCLVGNSVVLSERMAIKMFGTKDALGKNILRLDTKAPPLIVTGIMKDVPENSHFDLDIVMVAEADWKPAKVDYWKNLNWWTYCAVRNGTDIKRMEARLNSDLQSDQKGNPEFQGTYLSLQRIQDIHLYSHLPDEIKANGSAYTVFALVLAAGAILLLSWINYINLETSRFLTRMREVVLRRIIGSSQSNLVVQFMIQYLLLALISLIVTAAVVWLSLPQFSIITGMSMYIPSFFSVPGIIILLIVLSGSLFTGLYPAFLFAKVKSMALTKGSGPSGAKPVLRRTLLTFQFTISMVMIALLIIISHQIAFMRSSDDVANYDRILTIYNPTNYAYTEDTLRREKHQQFHDLVMQDHRIKLVSTSSAVPGAPVGFNYENFTKRNVGDPDDNIGYKVIFVDSGFQPMYTRLKAGRNYSEQIADDVNHKSLMLNERAIRTLGFTSAEKALNQEIWFMVLSEWEKYTIIGVVADYHHESAKVPVNPTIFFLNNHRGQMANYSVLIDRNANVEQSIASIQKAWTTIWPEKAFDYTFMDKHFDQQYKSEIRFGRIFSFFTSIASLLAGLGILGMTLFETNSRVKEISIRKVLGAGIYSLMVMLSRAYFRTTIIAGAVAVPLTYLAGTKWLEYYPVRVTFSFWYFLIPFIAILLLIILSSCFHTYRTAASNPIKHLKSE